MRRKPPISFLTEVPKCESNPLALCLPAWTCIDIRNPPSCSSSPLHRSKGDGLQSLLFPIAHLHVSHTRCRFLHKQKTIAKRLFPSHRAHVTSHSSAPSSSSSDLHKRLPLLTDEKLFPNRSPPSPPAVAIHWSSPSTPSNLAAIFRPTLDNA
ncbi:hypothetical protein GW17_00016760 [Ensete ventricosum]|nr:hypothetical protein GW17_00016760 [Ensete ventricosum]